MKHLIRLLIATVFIFISTVTIYAGEFPAKINDVYVIHFVLDGLNKKTFDNALDENLLPIIKKDIIDKGAYFTHGLSDFPSTSTTVYQSFVTGLFPGHAGIPHLERFDRQKEEVIGYLSLADHSKINSDLINFRALTNPSSVKINPPTTIFEFLEGYPTAAIYSSFNKGATYIHPEKVPIAAMWSTFVTHNEEHVNVLAYNEVEKLFSGDENKIPRYSLVGLYSTDIFGHKYGPNSKNVTDVLIQFDKFLGNFLSLLEKRDIRGKTYIIISADHGMHESSELFEFRKKLEHNGVVVKPNNPRIKKYTLYAANRGVASSQIYVRHNGEFKPLKDPEVLRKIPTKRGKTIDLIDTILNFEETDLLIIRAGSHSAKIYNRDGLQANISCYNLNLENYCSYSFDHKKGDPLGYSKNLSLSKFLDGTPHSSNEWLKATADEYYPDGVVALSQIFNDGQAGDMFVTTASKWGFRKIKEGNHGGATADDMRVPLMMMGPDIPHTTMGAARAADIFPAILSWYGIEVSIGNYDGQNPFDSTKINDTNWEKLAALEDLFSNNPPIMKMIAVDSFVREKVYPIVKTQEFAEVHKLALQELAHRSDLLRKLKNLKSTLNKKKNIDDHIAIVDGAIDWTWKRIFVMEDITRILSGSTAQW